ncbi:histidine phosphatase family protein [Synechococcus sp. CBW1002]|jgi:phosphohistidine phosphatase|uniref:SixA phosphatase family protein n=1 Tax=unclassified Synechococcus TaxID=2626047 RepID=UPI0018CDEA4D|nr:MULTISPECIES: histidine phosphatase family protein [unclassified Synechococcus]QPN60369.1 histidine phosphatase family protein [Synechococcus sp. CBW1002]QPN67915.1 histidine phosphatase family protein [Synechococcus sp. CBW1006]
MSEGRELLLLRHGIAEERSPDRPDAGRGLTPRGDRRTRAVVERLCALNLGCELWFTSPLLRARQTAAIAADLGLAPLPLEAPELAPEADAAPLLERCLAGDGELPAWSRLGLVGHEPDLSALAARLIGAPLEALELRKAGVILLALPSRGLPWGHSALRLLLSPRSLLAS